MTPHSGLLVPLIYVWIQRVCGSVIEKAASLEVFNVLTSVDDVDLYGRVSTVQVKTEALNVRTLENMKYEADNLKNVHNWPGTLFIF